MHVKGTAGNDSDVHDIAIADDSRNRWAFFFFFLPPPYGGSLFFFGQGILYMFRFSGTKTS